MAQMTSKLTGNPTKTRRIERNWVRDVKRRYRAFGLSAAAGLKRANDAAITVNAAGDPFVMSASQQRAYMEFLRVEINRLILETPAAPNWQAEYQIDAYLRGYNSTRAQLIAQGLDLVLTPEELATAAGLDPFTIKPTIATAQTMQPVHADALEFLFTRSYESLEGATDVMAKEIRQILFDAADSGMGSRQATEQMMARIGISERRAERIARTEINQAFSRSGINEINRAAEETEVDIKARWLTAIVLTPKGNPVRHNHAKEHGVVMTTARAAKIKREDGINCRCAIAPVIPGSETAARTKRFAKQRTQAMSISIAAK